MNTYYIDKINQIKKSCKCRQMIPFCVDCSSLISLELKKEEANLPIRYREFKLEDIQSPLLQEQKQAIIAYLENQVLTTNFYFYNGHNQIRTAIGCTVLIELLKKGNSCFFTNMDKCLGGTINNDEQFLTKVKESDFLLIDNLGSEILPESGILEKVLENILKDRLFQLKPTILTSSKTIDQLNSCFRFNLNEIMDYSLMIIKF